MSPQIPGRTAANHSTHPKGPTRQSTRPNPNQKQQKNQQLQSPVPYHPLGTPLPYPQAIGAVIAKSYRQRLFLQTLWGDYIYRQITVSSNKLLLYYGVYAKTGMNNLDAKDLVT